MTNTSKGGKKFAARKMADDPDYFANLARKNKGSRGKPFKKGNSFGTKGGKIGKRGPGRRTKGYGKGLVTDSFDLQFEDVK